MILGDLQYQFLRRFEPPPIEAVAYQNSSKLELLLGPILPPLEGKSVIDFGCGFGDEAADLTSRGATVYGVDIRDRILEEARKRHPGVWFGHVEELPVKADYIISLDSFEHFDDPAGILQLMNGLLRPGGEVIASFGPTWLHPLGGHLFSVFPWAHLLFSEDALIRWRSNFRSDGATRFGEVEGGLNQMTIKRFEKLIADSPFTLGHLECVPIRRARALHCRATREWLTSIVRCRLIA